MTRAAFNAPLEVRQQYLSMVAAKIPGEANWTFFDQGRVLTPDQAADEREYKRIGDRSSVKVASTVATSVNITLYVENDIEELARVLGVVRPGGGWVGTEELKLDPTKIIDFKIENYSGIDVGSALLFAEYVNRFRGSKLTMALDAEGDVRIAEITGACDDYYIIPAAGV